MTPMAGVVEPERAPPAAGSRGCLAPVAGRSGRAGDGASRRLSGDGVRRRARPRAADLLLHRRPRPAVRGRGAQLRHLASRPARIASSSSRTRATARAVTRKLFYEGFNYITGIEVGFGGVWVMSPPKLYFIPCREGDDKPSGEPRSGLRRLRLQGEPAQPGQRVHLGAGRLALLRPRPHQPVGRRPARHAGRPAHPLRWRRLPHSSDAARLRELRRRHHQSLGRRFRRLRPVLRLQLRQSAPVPHDPGRPLRTVAKSALQPLRLRPAAHDRRSPALSRAASIPGCAAKRPRRWHWAAAMPTAAR